MASFAWGISPSSAREQIALSKVGGCTLSDDLWSANLDKENLRYPTDSDVRNDPDVETCSSKVAASLVPQLLVRELVVALAQRMLVNTNPILNTPVVKVLTAITSSEHPPWFWLVQLIACFPCDGTPVTRCLTVNALLDAGHVKQSRVLRAIDLGVVPAEESVSDGVLPVNATTNELTTQ